MSSIYKLSIKGIRSFEPESEETIQFGSPLTLICGQNGCGKTTIIECLKYVTTGDLPPNSKNGAFVYDPGLSGRNTVNAQVKLAFSNVTKKLMIITRTMQLNRKIVRGRSTNTFKSLEGQLCIIEKKEKIGISTKNSELDSQTPIYLGASRTILDYIIFCHQDESLWPLGEPSILKKRFDDIFEASKFTKILETLKTTKKEMLTDMKLMEQSVNHLESDKKKSEKIKEKLIFLTKENEKLIGEKEKINIELKKKEMDLKNIHLLLDKVKEYIGDYEKLNITNESLDRQITQLASSIIISNDSDEELFRKKNLFNLDVEKKENDLKTYQNDLLLLKKNLDDQIGKKNELLRFEGLLKYKESDYKINLKKLEDFISKNSAKLYLKNFDNQCENFFNIKETLIENLNLCTNEYSIFFDEFEKTKNMNQIEIDSILNLLKEKRLNLDHCNDKLKNFEIKINEFEQNLFVNTFEEDKKKLVSDLNLNEKLIDQKKIDLNNLNMNESEKSEMLEIDKKLAILNNQIFKYNQDLDLNYKFDNLNVLINEKKKYIEELVNDIQEDFHLNINLDSNIDSNLNEIQTNIELNLKNLNSKLKSINDDNNYINNKLNETQYNLNFHQNQKKKTDNLICVSKNNILKVMKESEVDSFDSLFLKKKTIYEQALESFNVQESKKILNKTAINFAKNQNKCVLCNKHLDCHELDIFINELHNTINDDKILNLKKEIDEKKKDIDLFISIQNDVLNFKNAKIDQDQTLLSIENEKKNFDIFSENKRKNIITMQTIEKSIEIENEVNLKILNLKKAQEEINEYEGQIKEIQKTLKINQESFKNINDLRLEEKFLYNEKKRLHKTITENLELNCKIQTELRNIELENKDKAIQIVNLEKKINDNVLLNQTIQISKESQKKTEEEHNSLKLSIKDLEDLMNKKTKLLNDYKKKNENLIVEKKQNIEIEKKNVEFFTQTLDLIKKYENEVLKDFKKNTEVLNFTSRSIDEINNKISEKNELLQKINIFLSDLNKEKNQILLNIDYRMLYKDQKEVQKKIAALNIDLLKSQILEYENSIKILKTHLDNLNTCSASKYGEIKQITHQIDDLTNELKIDYHYIDKSYREEWIKLESYNIASSDLQVFSKALDNSIMMYHTLKMNDINKILGELWLQTYKGTDIESIAIKSDINEQMKNKKSYNYRVVMYKSGNELDMRGRCSAGQKVLASILIRLALAECFGLRCGIIALDEPTTNLDRENSISLAYSLNEIINYRKSQRNFQLIVITHDENFLAHINGDGHTDHFYRIQRDENQNSRIYRMSISKIQND